MLRRIAPTTTGLFALTALVGSGAANHLLLQTPSRSITKATQNASQAEQEREERHDWEEEGGAGYRRPMYTTDTLKTNTLERASDNARHFEDTAKALADRHAAAKKGMMEKGQQQQRQGWDAKDSSFSKTSNSIAGERAKKDSSSSYTNKKNDDESYSDKKLKKDGKKYKS